VLAVALASAVVLRWGQSQTSFDEVAYAWEPVAVHGGGWVTGLQLTDSGAVYARTDGGGAYRWDERSAEWAQIITFEGVPDPESADFRVESLAVAPSDDQVVYAAVGATLEARQGRVLRSEDAGQTWRASERGFTVHGNAQWRQGGARLAVDPADPDVVLLGTRLEGLWRSTDGGEDWERLSGLPEARTPADQEAAGVTFLLFDAVERGAEATRGMWAGVEGVGVLRSEDAGQSWDVVHETPDGVPRDAELGRDGRLFVVVAGGGAGVVRVSPDGDVVDTVSPGGTPSVVAVDTRDPDRVFVGDEGVRDGQLWRSEDGGDSWVALDVALESRDVRWPLETDLEGYMSAGDLTFDPARPGTLWFAEGMGVWRSDDLDDGEVTWSFTSTGIEQLVANDAVKPPGQPLLTAHWDRNLMRHPSDGARPVLTERFNSAWSLDISESEPSRLVAVVDDHRFCCDEDGLAALSGWSSDGGASWQRFGSLLDGSHPEGLAFGNIEMSSADPDDLVWLPSNGGAVHYSTDGGASWLPSDYPGSEPHFGYFLHRDVLAADPDAPGTFYALDADGILRSTDGGATWTLQGSDGLPARAALRFNATLATVPGRSGELVLTTGLLDEGSHGLFRSTDAGETWEELPGLQDVGRLAVGPALTAGGPPVLFATGRNGDTTGLWRSTDGAMTWRLLSRAPAGLHQEITVLSPDPEVPGEVYVGFLGLGFVSGRPV
jgi:photosystem II stability/assembly factor-like uncharacterized protein